MKNKLSFFSVLFCIMALFSSCRDESLNPVPTWGTALQAWGRDPVENDLSGLLPSFKATNGTLATNMRFLYNAVNGKVNCTKVEFYVNFNEAYLDKAGLLAVAQHGGVWRSSRGKLFKTLTAAELKNRTDVTFAIKPADIYALFKDNTFDYGDGKGKVKVFAQNGRTAALPFTTNDGFEIMWVLYGDDGKVYENWSNSVCNGEVIASPANCFAYWLVE